MVNSKSDIDTENGRSEAKEVLERIQTNSPTTSKNLIDQVRSRITNTTSVGALDRIHLELLEILSEVDLNQGINVDGYLQSILL